MSKLWNSAVFLLNSSKHILARNYAFKSDLKIKWNRPEKISCIRPEKSGDQSSMPNINKTDRIRTMENCKELEIVDGDVKKLFSLAFNPRSYTTEVYAYSLMDQVKRHELDYGSMESKLAKMTAQIRSMQVQMEDKQKRNKRMKVTLKEMIDKRKKFLTKLRRWDYKRFEWILEKLDLVYKAYPARYHWITRKESLQKLTDIHCENIRNERLNAYRRTLEDQQLGFLVNKLKNFVFIRQEQLDCGFPLTVTEEQIKEINAKIDELKAKAAKSEELEKKSKSSF